MKPWLALNQLDQEFELTLVDVLKGEQKTPEFLAVNPLGVVPYLITEDGHGIGESNAMLWYLADGTPLMPPTRAEQAEALQWMFFEQSKLEPNISPARFFSYILPQERDAHALDIAEWQERAKPGLARLNIHLNVRKFILASGYSIADIAMFGYVHVLEEAGLQLSDYPMIAKWIFDVTRTENFRPLAELGVQCQQAS
jgi:glutathione S-transferase